MRSARGCKVSVDSPGLAEVGALLDDHSFRTKRAKLHDQVGEDELRLEIQLNRHVLAIVLGLPPRLRVLVQISRCSRDDLIDRVRLVDLFHIAHITADVLQISDEAVAFGSTKTARGTRVEIGRSTDEQITRGWITTAMVTVRC